MSRAAETSPRVATGASLSAGRASAVLVVGSLLFSGMTLFAKAATRSVPAAEVAFVRSAFGLIACALAAWRRPFVVSNKWGLFWRGATGAVAVSCFFVAIEHLPVGIATLLNYTSPVFTALWAAALLGERIGLLTILALLFTTCGLGFVLEGQAPPGSLGVGLYQLIGIAGAIMSGLSMALIAEVRRTDGAWEIFAAFSLGCLLVSAPLALVHPVLPSPRAWLFLVGMGLFSVSAQLLMTHAMGYVSATLSGVVNQLTPAMSLLIGWIVFEEHFSPVTAFGIALTLTGGGLGAWLASRKRSDGD